MKPPKPIRTARGYRAAAKRIDELVVQPDAETTEELELLTILVMAYEAEHVPDPADGAGRCTSPSMDNRGLTSPISPACSAPAARQVLGGKRDLSKAMSVAEEWGLDANTLVGARRRAA